MKLTDISLENEPQSAIVYGPPKSGKTQLVVAALATKFSVLYIDLERGLTTLIKLPTAIKAKVELIRVFDNKENPNAINTGLKLAQGNTVKICEEHGATSCVSCVTGRKPFATYKLSDLSPNEWVVVFDSFTQLTSSSQAHVCKKLDLETQSIEFKHHKAQGVLLERFLDYVQNARYNCVVITHEMGLEQSDGAEKLQPSGGTKNFARNVPKYFDHIVYTTVKNRKHKAISSTTAENRIMCGSRTDAVVDMDKPETFCALFGK